MADTQSAQRDLDRSLLTGVVWTGAAKWTAQVLTWLATLLVARLLTPADYGIVGLAALYFGVIGASAEFGIGSAILNIRDLTREQIRQLNSLALVLGGTACLISLGLAVPLSRFFDEPRLARVVTVMSVAALISSLRIVPVALLRKELRFRKVAALEAAQAVIGALVSLALAISGAGYWALVLGILAGTIAQAVLTFAARPQGFARPHTAGIGDAVVFSRDVLASRLLWYFYDNSDFLVAGKLLGTTLLGAYRLAWSFASMPLDKLVSLVGQVTPAVLAAVQDKPEEMRRYVLRITEGLSSVVFPMSVGLALVAEDFVRALLGEAWLAAVLPLRILALSTCVRSISPIWSQALVALGDARYLMRVTAIGALLLPAAFTLGSRWGLVGVALPWLVVHPLLVALPILRRLMGRIDLKTAAYWSALSPAVGASLAMTGAVLLLQKLLSAQPALLRLAAVALAGAGVYIVSLVALAPVRATVLRHKVAAALVRGVGRWHA